MIDLQASSDNVLRWRRRRAQRRLIGFLKVGLGWALAGTAIAWLLIAGISGLGHP